MTTPILIQSGAAQLQRGAEGSASFPNVSASLIYSAQAYSSFPRALKLADGSGYLIALKGGVSHVGAGDGKILFSSDFSSWSVLSTITPESPTNAVQELVLCQHSDGRVQLVTRHYTYGTQASRNRVQYSSDNGATWTATASFGVSDFAYMTTRVGSDIYLAAYNNTDAVKLYRFTGDATTELIGTISSGTPNSEAAICVDSNGTMIAHIRHEPNGAASTIRTAAAPYTSWTTAGTWSPWHGQVIRRAPDGTLWGLGRWFHNPSAASGQAITAVVRYTANVPRVFAYLPPMSTGNGDEGYGDLIWIGSETIPRAVYYATGGATCAIYTATLTPV